MTQPTIVDDVDDTGSDIATPAVHILPAALHGKTIVTQPRCVRGDRKHDEEVERCSANPHRVRVARGYPNRMMLGASSVLTGSICLLAFGGCIQTPTTADHAEPLCTVPDDLAAEFGEIELTQSDTISTVFRVAWSPDETGTSWIRYGLPGASGETIAASAHDEGTEALLLGLKASTSYEYQLIQETDEGDFCTEPSSFTTGALPVELPFFDFQLYRSSEAAAGYTIVPANDDLGEAPFITILDGDGDPVWFYSRRSSRSRLSLDGEFMLTLTESIGPKHPGGIDKIRLDGSEVISVPQKGIHMDFVEVEPGVYASFTWDVRTYDDGSRSIAGERIVEFSGEGEEREVWNIHDYFQPDTTDEFNHDIPCCPEKENWVHLNFLHYSAEEDAYYLSSRYRRAVYKVDRTTGALVWTLTGRNDDGVNDFRYPKKEEFDFNPHSAMPIEGGLLIFDSGGPSSGGCSAAVELGLSTELWTVEGLGYYATEDCQVSHQMGNATELWNGNRTIVLATNGQIDEFNPHHDLVSRLVVSQGYWLGFSHRVQELYLLDTIRRTSTQ